MNIHRVLKWYACTEEHFTLERDFWFASIVTSPAQQTKALELERPELGGIVPSMTHDIPDNRAPPSFSCSKLHMRKVYFGSFAGSTPTSLPRRNNSPEYLLLHRESNNTTLDSLGLWRCPLNMTRWNPCTHWWCVLSWTQLIFDNDNGGTSLTCTEDLCWRVRLSPSCSLRLLPGYSVQWPLEEQRSHSNRYALLWQKRQTDYSLLKLINANEEIVKISALS